jgi:hypothetical protein
MLYRIILTSVLILLIFSGCSGKMTVTPDPGDIESTRHKSLGFMVDEIDSSGSPVSGSGILGLFEAQINPSDLTGGMTSLRSASLDDTLEMVDITNFLTLAPCSDCAKIMGIELDGDNHPVVKIGIKHPFDVGDPLKPISGRNRADLHVFNVEGTVIFEDSSGVTSFPAFGDSIGPAFLMNADGYSPYLDPALDEIFPTDSTIHPYKLHFDDYSEGNFNPTSPTGFESVTTPPPSGNLVMAMGCGYDIKDYVFNIPPDGSFEFMFAVGCTYAVSAASKIQRFTPEYQIPQHNKKAASEVTVEFVSNNLAPGQASSSAELLIKVLDMNHGVAVGEALNEMKADSSVSAIQVEVPGVTSGIVNGSTTPTGGDPRNPDDPLTFSVTFTNALGAGEAIYPGLVKVVDSYTPGLNESPLLNSMDAIKRVDPLANPLIGLYALDEFATYACFDAIIAEDCGPIVEGSFTSSVNCEDPVQGDLEIIHNETLTFTASGFSSPNANAYYEWDFGDGSPVDTSGPQVSHLYTNPNCGNSDADVIYTVTLTVTDDCAFPSTPVVQQIDATVKCFRKTMTLTPSAETQVPNTGPMGSWAFRYSPALSQDDDGDIRMAAYLCASQTYSNDWAGVLQTADGLSWSVCQGMTGGGGPVYHDRPIKVTPNKGSTDSYAAYTWWTSTQHVATMRCPWEGYSFDFASFYSLGSRELFSNRTTGYLFYFTTPSNNIQMQRSPIPNQLDYVNGVRFQNFGTFASGDDPHLSYTRSCAEDEDTGIMYLVYYRNSGNAIRMAKSDTSVGNTWTISTIYEDTTGTYDQIVNPTIDIDGDGRMHVAFLRKVIVTDEIQLVYMQSNDFGDTFCIQKVVDIGSYSITEPTIDAFSHYSKDWVALCYTKDSQVFLSLSEDQGHSFGHSMQISGFSPTNSEPDMIMTTNGWLQFVWTIGTDPMTNGDLYCRKVVLSN